MKIVVKNVCFRFLNNNILEDIDMQIHTGQIICLLGLNGSGKSTLFKLITGGISPSEGSIYVQGRNDAKANSLNIELNDIMAILPQDMSDPVQLKVKEIIALSRFNKENSITWKLYDKDTELINIAIMKCNISDLMDRQFTSLSAGQKQRVWLAFCLAQGKPFLLLDESLSALDVFTKNDCFKFLKEVALEGKGILLITHDIDLAKEYADKIVVLNKGKIIFDGDPKKFTHEIMQTT
jgi:iron complex transport system ATP-binding protein